MASIDLLSSQLTDKEFRKISHTVKSISGIDLHEGKKELIKARLHKRLRQLKLKTFSDYVRYLRHDHTGSELTAMLDAISTNMTSFFREDSHFTYLTNKIVPAMNSAASKPIRIWSAGCSSGEEPYSIAITLLSSLSDSSKRNVKILATDISTRILAKAKQGTYDTKRLQTVAPHLRLKYFRPVQTGFKGLYEVKDELRNMIHFARLNLMENWPMKGPFDVIFCRNVMIYFDKATQTKLVERFFEILAPGGILFIGHSESLTGARHKFRYVEPTVYQKL